MSLKFLTSGLILISLTAQAQMGGVTGALNQIDEDPALEGFQNSYDDLQEEVRDLDEPEKQEERLPTDAMEKTESSYPASPDSANFIEEQ